MISVFGCGYVGLTTAACLADMGHAVIGVDVDEKKLNLLRRGRVPFFEPGLQDVLKRNIAEKRLSFTTKGDAAIDKSDIVMCAVATPQGKRRQADLSAVLQVAKTFALNAAKEKIFINKSTVPVGTTEIIRQTIEKKQPKPVPFTLVYHPEFLREGSALQDFFKPDRVIFGLAGPDSIALPNGVPAPDEKTKQRLRRIFKITSKTPALFTSYRNAEIIKYASNAFLATRLSFVNELAEFCEAAGGDIEDVVQGMGHDQRIGHRYMRAGIGFGGSCLPKDLQVLISSGNTLKHDFSILKAVQQVNKRQPQRLVRRMKTTLGPLRGKRVAVWGLAFKPDTDDLRDAPSIQIVEQLLRHKMRVHVYDPAATDGFKKIFGAKVSYGEDAYSVLRDADALLLLTEWPEFCKPDFAKMKRVMRRPLIVDGRNVYNPQKMAALQFQYYPVGRA